MARYLLIPPGRDAPRWIEGERSYKVLRDGVGGLIECLPYTDERYDLWCNEEYCWAYGEPPDPDAYNGMATALWATTHGGAACVAAHPVQGVYGPVVMTGPCDDNGETLDLPNAVGDLVILTHHTMSEMLSTIEGMLLS